MPRRTALIVAVPEAEPAVGALRLQHDSSAPLGVPAHVTILFPFLPPERIDEAALRAVFASRPTFEFTLDRVERFDSGLVWLHPEPSEPFAALTRLVWSAWPDHPPYEGAHDTVIPHLTVSEEPIELDLALPIAARASHVTLIEEEEPGGRWAARLELPLSAEGSRAG
jgi:2'-5' RNA ligase superfamily